MGLRDRFSNYLYRKLEKRGLFDDILGNSIRYGGRYVSSDNILESSDVYELLQDISNQMMLAEIVVEDKEGKEIKDDFALKVLKNPNNYLTQSEFIKLMTNTYLLQGETFPVLDGDQLHLASNVYTELDDRLIEHFKVGGEEISSFMIRHVKNIGADHLKGKGILDLGKDTLEGVMSAEKTLTDKYKKGGLLAFMLKMDAHINPKNGAQSILIKAILDQLESIDESRSVKMIPLGKGYSIETLKSPLDDEKTLAYLNVYKKDLGKFLGINVDTYTALIKEDLEKSMMYLHNKAVRPIMKNFEDHLSLLFFGKNSDKRIKFKINILDFVTYSMKTNIAYNIVRTGITSPDNVADMLGFPKQNTPESQAIYISNDLTEIGKKNATDDSLKGGDGNGKDKGNTDI
ncbi:phage portal protein [Bacillus thuringiensis]|uniref:Portal protein n=4 Tax=Bacillus thuringiensis TaxID=1428 RepID=A0A9X6KPI9_BACTU|nr:phage portal protein [Bacillus thuringiensis]AJA22120.1 portal protein [Bacillus thuringiensis serovar galleriae]OTY97918.1 portal protein [Bacillus thuringiensis serovar aizawai]OTY98434.1 portal protein [Bacillus thuringiensis serovar aizawai]OTZ11020.1 portal protein [Bacillus thuringiensis serovar aizawai]OUA13476.1 portal protein [Bacillus thuringiensis]